MDPGGPEVHATKPLALSSSASSATLALPLPTGAQAIACHHANARLRGPVLALFSVYRAQWQRTLDISNVGDYQSTQIESTIYQRPTALAAAWIR